MSRNGNYKPSSLAEHFDAPDHFMGTFGWMCGYSADAAFLDDAAERFTRQIKAQRAYTGRISLALMLDAGNPQISPVDVPGVMHLPLHIDSAPFGMLHAKVALLAFRHETQADNWLLRLIVSTGNWTRETLEQSLDLAWSVSVSKEDLDNADDEVRQACVDIAAAWELLSWLKAFFDARALASDGAVSRNIESVDACNKFDDWVGTVSNVRVGKISPRFFDNRGRSLLKQLPVMAKRTNVDQPTRNYIGLGSGFFESPGTGSIPPVINQIVSDLQNNRLLTNNPEVDVFVNPKACQSVAQSLPAFDAAGWHVREAVPPAFLAGGPPRTLHAKFIFSANYRENSPFCNSAWLYLGSGNLTKNGFQNKLTGGGNLEAGVVIGPEGLRWKDERGADPDAIVTNRLPVQRQAEFDASSTDLCAGSDMLERLPQFLAGPVAFLLWCSKEGKNWLEARGDAPSPFSVIGEDGQACHQEPPGRFLWPTGRQRQVLIRWSGEDGKRCQSWVPVLDELGRFAATDLPRIDLEAAWHQLASFPMPPDPDDVPDPDDPPTIGTQSKANGAGSCASYPVREVMQLIENIASKQTSISKEDWRLWCHRLEQCLVQAADTPVLRAFLDLRMNPLSPLWHPAFRPEFAETADSTEGQCYEAVLQRVANSWNVNDFEKLGASV
jgi:hypothetical protein